MPAADAAADPQEQLDAERRVRELLRKGQEPADVEALAVQLSHLPLRSLAPLAQCCGLRRLDASRNCVKSLAGAERLVRLESLNLYSNKLADLGELLRLRPLGCLSEVCAGCPCALLPPRMQADMAWLLAAGLAAEPGRAAGELPPLCNQVPAAVAPAGRTGGDRHRAQQGRLSLCQPRLQQVTGPDCALPAPSSVVLTADPAPPLAIRHASRAAGSSSGGGSEDLSGAEEGSADESREEDPPASTLAAASCVLLHGSQQARGEGPTLDHGDLERLMLHLQHSAPQEAKDVARSAGGAGRQNGDTAMQRARGSATSTTRDTAVSRSEQRRGSMDTDVHDVVSSAAQMGWNHGFESLLQENQVTARADSACPPPKFLCDSPRAQLNRGNVSRDDAQVQGAETVSRVVNSSGHADDGKVHQIDGPRQFEYRPGAYVATDAANWEVQRLVEAQGLRVKEIQGRLEAALEETRACRARAVDAEKRAAAAEAKLSAALAAQDAARLPARQTASAMPSAGMLSSLSSSSSRAVGEAAVEPGLVTGGPRFGASGDAQAATVTHAVDVAEVVKQQRELIDMLRESHAILMTDSHRLRAEVEAERAGRRKDALDYEANWKEFQALRVLVHTSPAFEKRAAGSMLGREGSIHGDVDQRPACRVGGGASETIGSLSLSSSVQSQHAPLAESRTAGGEVTCSKEEVSASGQTSAGGGGVWRGRSEGEAYAVSGGLPMHLLEQQQHLRFMRALEMDEDDAL